MDTSVYPESGVNTYTVNRDDKSSITIIVKYVEQDSTLESFKTLKNLFVLVFHDFIHDESNNKTLLLDPMFIFRKNGSVDYSDNLLAIFNALAKLQPEEIEKLNSRTILFKIKSHEERAVREIQTHILEEPEKYLIRE
jgi:hypothetical protein